MIEGKDNEDGVKKVDWPIIVMMAVGMVLIIVALLMLVFAMLSYRRADNTYNDLRDTYVLLEDPDEEKKNGDDKEEPIEDDTWWYRNVYIDLAGLQSVNSDVVGWIRFDNIGILNYPILYSGDDVAYLYKDIYGRDSNSGCIFLEGENTPDFNDSHTIIYGHNMKNGSMFGLLKNYNTEGFYEENRFFTIYADGIAYRYEIFAYEEVDADDEIYTIGYVPGQEFAEFLDMLRRKSYIAPDIIVKDTDKIVTLSTCTTTDRRFVVHGVCFAAHSYGR